MWNGIRGNTHTDINILGITQKNDSYNNRIRVLKGMKLNDYAMVKKHKWSI